MRIKLKSFIVIIILFLSTLIGIGNSDLRAKSPENKNITSRLENRFDNYNFDWSVINVVSEPIPGANFNTGDSSNPSIAVEDDKIYVVWQDENDISGAGVDRDIFYRYFDSNSWSAIQVISEPIIGQNFNTEESGGPDIAVVGGKIFVVWHDYNNTNSSGTDLDIFYRSNLTGSKWEDIQVISEPIMGINNNVGSSGAPKIAIENDKIYVVWHDYTNINNCGGLNPDIFYRSNLTGSSWEDILVISEPIFGQNYYIGSGIGPDIAVENGKIYVVWGGENDTNNAGADSEIFFRCNITGSSWENIQVISEPREGLNINTGGSHSPAIAVENDKIYVIWYDNNNTNGAGTDTDILYRSNLIGSRWEDIQVISEPIQGQDFNIEGSLYPEIIVEYSKIYIVWYDFNNTNSASGDFDIFYRCNLTGSNWEDIQVISEPVVGSNFNTLESKWPDIAVDAGKSHIVWQDKNNTNAAGTDYDIFYRYVSLPLILSHPSLTPISGNTSTYFNFAVKYTHLTNTTPTKITATISGTEYSMLEVDSTDTNYIDGKDYFFNIKNLDIGVHSYQFHASDGKFTWFTTLVNKPTVYNTPPNITSDNILTAIEDTDYMVKYEYNDIDVENVNQVITWKFLSNADWLKFDPTMAILNGTPTNDDVGEYWINISINDMIDSDFTNFTLTVININDAPAIITNDIEMINEDEYYEISYEATDVDIPEDDLIWTMNTNATWLDFEPTTALLFGTPTNDDVGQYWVNISVNDNVYIDYSNFTLKVVNVNDPPKIITNDVNTATEEVYYEVDYEAEDVDHASIELTWTIATNAKWLAFDTTNAIINGTPSNDDVGEYWVYISVSDYEYNDTRNFTLTVVNVNDPPEIITEDKIRTMVGELYSVNYEAEDIDPPPVTLTWTINSNASNWLTIDASTGWLNGLPLTNDVGSYWINVSVNDGENGWDFHNFTLHITQEPEYGDEDFRLSNPKMVPKEGNTETEFTFSIFYYNSENKGPISIQLSMDGNIYDMELKSGENASNGIYEHMIKLTEGIHTYYFLASNGSGTIKTDNFATPYINKVDKSSSEESTWYWLIWIIIIVISILSLIVLYIYKKRKAARIPTVRAELLYAPPEHLTLPSATPSVEGTRQLSQHTVVSEQLPTPKVPLPSLAPPSMKPVPQLPQATLSKAQKLGLLEERFLRGEVDIETYKELKTKIESSTGGEIPEGEIEELPPIEEQPPTTPEVPPEQVSTPGIPPPEVTSQVQQPQVEPAPQPAPKPQVEEQPTPQVEQPQVGVQEPAVEQPAESPQPQVPKIKTESKIEENDA